VLFCDASGKNHILKVLQKAKFCRTCLLVESFLRALEGHFHKLLSLWSSL